MRWTTRDIFAYTLSAATMSNVSDYPTHIPSSYNSKKVSLFVCQHNASLSSVHVDEYVSAARHSHAGCTNNQATFFVTLLPFVSEYVAGISPMHRDASRKAALLGGCELSWHS
jgi:hypothetical protein